MASSQGNQIFVSMRKGDQYPPAVIECRIKYEQTIGDIRKAVSSQAGIALDKVQLFRHGKELIPEKYDAKTLLEMDLHTGFSLMGYDLTEKPVYWPPVKETSEGLQVISAIE
eukprot:jgi/Picsp_1/6840/NSC_04177-R1_hypothetical protein VOLCADRAFT_90160 [Volvox carteri f. nagariensis]